MRTTIYFADKSRTVVRQVIDFMARHNINVVAQPIERRDKDVHDSELRQTTIGSVTTVQATVGGKTYSFVGTGSNSLLEALSKYLLRFHTYSANDLTCRNNSSDLLNYVTAGSPELSISPLNWIQGNELFKLHATPLTKRLTNFVLNKRGMFLKIWELDCEKNYWNSSLNGGIPVTRKRDEIHEGTFLLHDMFHFMFRDPFVRGNETITEKATYIAHRMMSEACTQVLADMVSVSDMRLDETGYDTSRRRIFPVFKSTGLQTSDVQNVLKLMHANAWYCFTDDDSEFKSLGADYESLEAFKEKYGIYFAVDFEWNAKNIEYMTSSQKGYDRGLYASRVCKEIASNSVSALYERVRTPDNQISFEKMFSIFAAQIIEVMEYRSPYSPVQYVRSAAINYLSGQILIAVSHPNERAPHLLQQYESITKRIESAVTTTEILDYYHEMTSLLSAYIQRLENDKLILPHEAKLFHLHVPHFPAQYYSYDLNRDAYPSLASVATTILAGHLDITSSPMFDLAVNK